MPKISLTVNQETEDALRRISDKTEIPIAVLMRKALEQYLADQGERVNAKINWGGHRHGERNPLVKHGGTAEE